MKPHPIARISHKVATAPRAGLFAAFVALVLMMGRPAHAAAQPDPADTGDSAEVRYTIDTARSHAQILRISAEFPIEGRDTVRLHLPVWRPGRYVFLDSAGAIRALAVRDDQGRPLSARKIRRSSWEVQTAGSNRLLVDYELFADALSLRTVHADDTHAFVSASGSVIYAEHTRDRPCVVYVLTTDDQDARGWRVATALDPAPGVQRAWLAPSYDALVDAPLEIGVHARAVFETEGAEHEIVVWGDTPDGFDPAAWAEDFAAVARVQSAIFGGLPYQRYLFIVHAGEGLGGGTEHYNSTVMQTSPRVFHDDERYDGFLGLMSHELFHTWNVKRLRPAGITPYDYQAEQLTPLLWVAEGTTSYYDDLSLVRAGLLAPDAYLKALAGSITRQRRNPGRLVQSLEDASTDAWLKHNKRLSDHANTTVNFYSDGALASLALDAVLRDTRRDPAYSLDRLMRTLYERYPLAAGGYDTADLIEAAHADAAIDIGPFIARHVSGTDPIDFESVLAVFGLDLRPTEPEGSVPDLGFALDSSNTVSRVLEGGPAFDAGLHADDEVVAINGRRLRGGSVADAMATIAEGDAVTLTVFRRGVLKEIAFAAAPPPPGPWELRRVEAPTDRQRAQYESWLGQPWPADSTDLPSPQATENP